MKLFKLIRVIKCCSLLLGIFYVQNIFSQTKKFQEVQIMPLIKIKQTRINLTTGNKLIKLDSALLSQMSHQNLGDVLANESSLFIKNYGPSNLSSSSFRGGNAAQTSVLWNGFQLNNTLNGQVDFSLIPTGFHNDVTIQYGGSSALWGSGALGGAIFLGTKPQWEKGFQAKLNFTVSSFSNFQQQLSLGWSTKKISSNLQLLHQTAKNNFGRTAFFATA